MTEPVAAGRAAQRRSTTGVDPVGLAFFRIAFGLVGLLGVGRYVGFGWVDELYRQPAYFFGYEGLDWITAPAGAGIYGLYGLLAALSLLIAAGLFTRGALVGYGLLFLYVELIDKSNWLNHYWFIGLVALLLAAMPTEAAASLDARWRGRGRARIPAWTVQALRLQVGLVYVFAGLAKLEPDWLLRGEPLATWMAAQADFPVLGVLVNLPGMALLMAWAGMLFDLSIPLWLSWKRSRAVAYAAVVGFHLVTGLLMNIGVFPLLMMLGATVFFEPDWPRRLLRRIWPSAGRNSAAVAAPPARTTARLSGPGRLGLAALACWFLVQLALPLRHLAYPGPTWWTGDGWRFAWRVMLVEKRGWFRYTITDPDTGRGWRWHPDQLLTPRQQHVASCSPDMILQLAHHLAQTWPVHDVQVHAESWCSVNGRPSQRLVDPAVDLAARPRSLWRSNADFVLPWDPTPRPEPVAKR